MTIFQGLSLLLIVLSSVLIGICLGGGWSRLSRKRNARTAAKEFTQYMILADNALLWVMVLGYMFLALYSIYKGFTGGLPWLTGGLGLAFASWATIQAFVIKKSEKQNTKGGITYDMAMKGGADKEEDRPAY